MKYFVNVIETEDKEFIWCVMETATDQLIDAFLFNDDATKYVKFLNKGGAFDGWTPTFVLNDVTSLIAKLEKEEINEEFEKSLDS